VIHCLNNGSFSSKATDHLPSPCYTEVPLWGVGAHSSNFIAGNMTQKAHIPPLDHANIRTFPSEAELWFIHVQWRKRLAYCLLEG
jgi:hypothetical protein